MKKNMFWVKYNVKRNRRMIHYTTPVNIWELAELSTITFIKIEFVFRFCLVNM